MLFVFYRRLRRARTCQEHKTESSRAPRRRAYRAVGGVSSLLLTPSAFNVATAGLSPDAPVPSGFTADELHTNIKKGLFRELSTLI